MAHLSGADAASQVRPEVMAFRLVELQQVAERLCLKKTGRKGELQNRILAYCGELDPGSVPDTTLGRSAMRAPPQQWKVEQAAKVVHEVYHKMKGLPATAPSDQSAHSSLQMPPGGGAGPAAAAAQQQQQQQPYYAALEATRQQQMQIPGMAASMLSAEERFLASFHQQHAQHPPPQQQQQQWAAAVHASAGAGTGARQLRVRCICHMQSEQGRMVMCEGKGCGVWEHCACLGRGSLHATPTRFLCELCRARLADPFWEATEQVLAPMRLKMQPGLQMLQYGELIFYLNQQQLGPAQCDPANHRVQVGCLLVDDEVAQRYHWPQHVDLKVNNLPHRPYGRAVNAKMGINQRDDVASIGLMVVRGRNSLSMSTAEGGTWVLTLQLARRRNLEQVKALMAAPESLEAATARVRHQVGGAVGNESDDDLLVSHQVVSLKDPMSGQRMQVPARFADASGLQSFDLDSFLSMAQRNRKWQDPTTLHNSTVEQLQVDSYTQRVIECLKGQPGVTDVEVSAEGQWRPDGSSGQWFDIGADPAIVAAALAAPLSAAAAAAAGAGGGGGTSVKPDPDAGVGGSSAPASGATRGSGGGAGDELVVADIEEEEEEAEELRKAAAAVRKVSSAALESLVGQKRKQEAEVIDLLSSDEEEDAPRPHMQQTQQQAQQQHRTAQPQQQAGPLRIRLPMRPRPQFQQAGGAPSPAVCQPVLPTRQVSASGAALPPAGLWSNQQSGLAAPPPLFHPAQQQQGGQHQQGPGFVAQGQPMGGAGGLPDYQPQGPPYFSPPPSGSAEFSGFMPASQLMGGSHVLPMVRSDCTVTWQQRQAQLAPQQASYQQLQQQPQDAMDTYRADWSSDEALQALFEDDY